MGIFFSEFVLLFNTNPALIAFIWTIISFGIGLWYGDKRAITRYRLDKFNTVSDPIELFLTAELERLKQGKVVLMSRGFEFDALRLHLPRRQQAAYKKAVNDYLSAINRYGKQCSQTGAVNLSPDIPSAIVAIEKILTYAKHR